MKEKVEKLSPWMDYVNKLEAFFAKDKDVIIDYIEKEDTRVIKIKVNGQKKADALELLLPPVKTFGNVDVDLIVIPSNEEETKASLIRAALEGNEAVNYIETTSPPFSSNPFTYVVFKKEVVQYWDDNLGDINGLTSTLYQNLARELFCEDEWDSGGVYFCTDEE